MRPCHPRSRKFVTSLLYGSTEHQRASVVCHLREGNWAMSTSQIYTHDVVDKEEVYLVVSSRQQGII